MANALYPSFKQGLLNKEHNCDTDTIKATLFDAAYESYSASDNTYVQGTYGINDTAKKSVATLLNTTIALGVFDSDNGTFAAVPAGDPCDGIILWNDTHASDALMAWYDAGITGTPVTPNGGDINFTVHSSGWFAL